MMLIVVPVIMSANITPMSDSGSEIMIASGSRNEPNCMTRMRYISITAMPSAEKMRPNTSFWLSTSPPCVMCTPGGKVILAIRALMSFITSVSGRLEVFA